ncbi:hypothetical protein AKJ09_00121 [Labilithrix luteola]|uniref:Tetratricopeptide repeat protein n=1 Tax=Labilithrix luteola TaxID=1391654 RepID=A0A0K1PIW0_9BACT|nr:hypothetical protein [Labilithrix luteola]AKU93457.1 hypothetical protein AKJ09_00121 [Labilithrix luteola]
MSNEGHEKGSLLSPMGEEYAPSQDDAARIFSKIQASLVAQGVTPKNPESVRPSSIPDPKRGFRSPKGLLAIGLSCVVAAGVFVGKGYLAPSPEASSVVTTKIQVSSPTPPSNENVAISNEPPPALVMPSLSVDELPTAKPSPSASAKSGEVAAKPTARPAATTTESDNDGLAREAALLAEARQAEQRGDDARALERLDEHARTFPNGWLAADRAAERVIVLCNLGRREEAVREAAAFLQGRPKSPLTRRIATSCAGQP